MRALLVVALSVCVPASAHAQTPEWDLADALRARADDACRTLVRAMDGDEAVLPCDAIDVHPIVETGTMHALVADARGGGHFVSVLAVEGAGERRVAMLAHGYTSGVGATWVEGETTVEAIDVVPGGAPEIHARLVASVGDSDMGTCDFLGHDTELHVLCSTDGGVLVCASVRTTDVVIEDHELCGDVLDADGDGLTDEPLPGELEVHRRNGYTLAVSFGRGRVVLAPGPDDTRRAPLSGAIRASTLLARRRSAWSEETPAIALWGD